MIIDAADGRIIYETIGMTFCLIIKLKTYFIHLYNTILFQFGQQNFFFNYLRFITIKNNL